MDIEKFIEQKKNTPKDVNILDFYKNNEVLEEFDHEFYNNKYRGLEDFYQPYCKENNISERKRLFFHWFLHGFDFGYSPSPNIKFKKDFDPNIVNEDISIVVACKDRQDMLSVSIRSWILKPQVKEIIVVDWSSSEDLKYFEDIDPRIRVIRVEGQEFYNASKPINIAIKEAKYEKILKMDVDYIINPYCSLESLVDIQEGEFVAGNYRQFYLDNDLGFLRNLNGIICCHRKFFLEAGLYNENIDNYGREDCEMFDKLKKNGVKRKDIDFHTNQVPVYHNPHNHKVRGMNRKDSDTNKTLLYFNKKFGQSNFQLVINLHRDPIQSRTEELINCLKLNLENKYIDRVHVFLENYDQFPEFYELKEKYEDKISVVNTDSRVSFRKIFDYTNKNIRDTQCIVANSDILFTEDLSKIRGMQPRDIISLTRHEGEDLLQNRHRNAYCSQDAWIFRSPMLDDLPELDEDIVIGTCYSDVVLNYLISRSEQYSAWNLCHDIVIQHCHKTTEGTHDSETRDEIIRQYRNFAYKFNDSDFDRHLSATSLEDYYLHKNQNKFMNSHEYDLKGK